MEDFARRRAVGDLNLASRRAEEAALRRYQAVHWLDYLVGPLGIPSQPSENEFISCLRNGLILCKVMNIVQPGSVSKVIEKSAPSPSPLWDSQPLPAYQYFENVRNFLAAVGELKLPIFDASVFERENLQEGLSTKVVDCILALKDYHEWRQMTGGNEVYKPPKSPLVVHSVSRIHARALHPVSHGCSRQLDMVGGSIQPMPQESDIKNLEDKIVRALEEHLVDGKENMDNNLFSSHCSENRNSVSSFKILTSCLEEEFQRTFPEIKSNILVYLRELCRSPVQPTSMPLADLSNIKNRKCCRACLKKGRCNHWDLVEHQEKKLSSIKLLLSNAKQEVKLLQSQLRRDIKQLEDQVLEMSTAALGYHNAVKENRNLYNMVQDLQGSIRVYCRIRPVCSPEVQNVNHFIGEDGSLVVVDSKQPRDRKQMFQFNHIFGPAASQDDVFREIQPLVRTVMDGYNACIFAYGQTGSGKTHTMLCPPAMESGISYLALNDLFELCDQRKDITKYEIQAQMVEICNEQVRDLLAKDSGTEESEIRSCVSDTSVALPDSTLLPVKSTVDVINVMRLGEQNRVVGSPAMESIHSHCVLSVHVKGEDATGSVLHSCLRLVDLAGSEWADKPEATGDKTLACLIDVLTALAQKNSRIPFENSKLTSLLQNSLGGNAKTLMIAHVNPEGDSFEETMSTLRFAQRVSSFKLGAARSNKESTEVLELKAQLETLKKKALGSKDAISPMKRENAVAGTPCKKPKQMAERTPPQSRRMSIENRSSMATQRSMNYGGKMGAKTPSEKSKGVVSPPPHSRRLSNENGTTTPLPRSMNQDDKRTVRTPPEKSYNRRSSLGNVQKESCHIKLLEAVTPGPRCMQKHSQVIDGKSPAKISGLKETNESLLNQSYQSNPRAPRSPTRAALRSSVVRFDTATMKATSCQIPITPEPKLRNSVHTSLPSNSNLLSEIQTPCSTHVKGSQARKSLRSIGKLIKGTSDKRKQKQAEARTPAHGMGNAKSPISSDARALRRQSLTGVQPPGMPSAYGNGEGNAKTQTPPQSGSSTKFMKRWL